MRFIVFEGLDGSGKSTLMNKLKEHLEHQGIVPVTTREPGGTTLGDEIRHLILRTDGEAPTSRTELLLYEASRAQHVEKFIRPMLQEKKWVLCDRFTASSIAFQGGGRVLSEADIEWLNNFAVQDIKPHLTVLLDLTEEESQKRREGRQAKSGVGPDRIELEKNDFHQRVRDAFLKEAHKDPKKWLVLDASLPPMKLFENLLTEITARGWLA